MCLVSWCMLCSNREVIAYTVISFAELTSPPLPLPTSPPSLSNSGKTHTNTPTLRVSSSATSHEVLSTPTFAPSLFPPVKSLTSAPSLWQLSSTPSQKLTNMASNPLPKTLAPTLPPSGKSKVSTYAPTFSPSSLKNDIFETSLVQFIESIAKKCPTFNGHICSGRGICTEESDLGIPTCDCIDDFYGIACENVPSFYSYLFFGMACVFVVVFCWIRFDKHLRRNRDEDYVVQHELTRLIP